MIVQAIIIEESFISLSKGFLLESTVAPLVLTTIWALILIFLLFLHLVDLIDSRVHKVVVNVFDSESAFRPFERPVSSSGIVITTLSDFIVTLRPVIIQTTLFIIILIPHPNLTNYWLIL